MMAQLSTGKTLLELQELSDQVRSMMRGRLSDREAAEMGDLLALQAVRQYPVRIKCALLPWTALEVGVEEFISKQGA
jgi:nitrogen fixation NifU-like protein